MITTTKNRATTGKVIALGLLLTALMAASLLAASHARASTTFTVNSTEDHSDAVLTTSACDTGYQVPGPGGAMEAECTLRAAMEQANFTPGADAINFAIPGSGMKTISPVSQLPTITGPVTINGYSQPGAEPNQSTQGTDAVLKIELSGAKGIIYVDGLVIDAPNSTVKGLVINDFAYSGIILTSAAVGTKIEGNLIGTKRDGTTALRNEEDGVRVTGRSSTVGGNTVAFNGGDGVAVLFDARGGSNLSNSVYNNAEEGIDLGLDFGDDGPTANSAFAFSPVRKVDVGRTVTATATNPAGSTSEFSVPRMVASS